MSAASEHLPPQHESTLLLVSQLCGHHRSQISNSQNAQEAGSGLLALYEVLKTLLILEALDFQQAQASSFQGLGILSPRPPAFCSVECL